MAPEQLRGQEVDHRCDQFSLAVVLYELLTGEIPQGAVKPPHALRRSVPAATSQAIMKALEARPDERHADMAALARALQARSATGIGVRAALALATTVLLGSIATFLAWRSSLYNESDDRLVAKTRPDSSMN
jgi:serine/threonine protein kinase